MCNHLFIISLRLTVQQWLHIRTTKQKLIIKLNMGLRAKTCKEIRKELSTKIHWRPTDQDITLLEKKLISIAANVPTALGGGNHGHAGIIVEPTKYLVMMGGTAFVNPVHPGIYPAGLTANAAAGTRAMAEAVQKNRLANPKSLQE